CGARLRAVRRRLCAHGLVAIREAARVRAGESNECIRHVPADGTGTTVERKMNALANDPVLAVAVRAARTAASIVADSSRDLRRLPAFSKEHGDIVANAKIEVEDALVATIRGAFPDHAI